MLSQKTSFKINDVIVCMDDTILLEAGAQLSALKANDIKVIDNWQSS